MALAHHCRNEENMLIGDSSAGGKIKQSKQHLRCSLCLLEEMDRGGDKGGEERGAR